MGDIPEITSKTRIGDRYTSYVIDVRKDWICATDRNFNLVWLDYIPAVRTR